MPRRSTCQYFASLAATLAALVSGPMSTQADDKAGILSGCKLLATLVMENCEVRQVMRCEQRPPDDRRIDVYSGGKFRGTEEYMTGLILIDWRRGRYLQEVKVDKADEIRAALRRLQIAKPGASVDYTFTRIRRVLRSDKRQEMKGSATIRNDGIITKYVGDRRLKVLRFETKITWPDGTTSERVQYYPQWIRHAVSQKQYNYQPGKKRTTWNDEAVLLLESHLDGFGLVSPPIKEGACTPPK